MRARRGESESAAEEATEEPGDEGEEVVAGLNLGNLNVETEVTQEEAEKGLEVALGMEVEEDIGSKGKEEGGGTHRAL